MALTHQTTAGNVARLPNKVYPNIFAQIEGSVACVALDVPALQTRPEPEVWRII